MAESVNISALLRQRSHLYSSFAREADSWSELVLGKELQNLANASTQDFEPGDRALPFNAWKAKQFIAANSHHAACLRAKVACSVGLGFVTEEDEDQDPAKKRRVRSKVLKTLSPLCSLAGSFQQVFNDAIEDYWNVGNGYIEVVRDDGGAIIGLYHVAAETVGIYLERDEDQSAINWHYTQRGQFHRKFARFGDVEAMVERNRLEGRVAEIIHFRKPSSLNRWFGMPDWFAAIAVMELVAALHTHTHDFFINRGVPEFLLFFLGSKIDDDNWKKINDSINSHIGLGNSHKSMALNLLDPDMKVQLEKLAIENGIDAEAFAELGDALALQVVSAHGVPPLLAGIQIPGKLGANNELPNALRAFQLLLIGPAQQIITEILDCTLGNPELNGKLDLAEGDFILRSITDELDLDRMGTSASMRQTETEAQQEGRDLSEGLKD